MLDVKRSISMLPAPVDSEPDTDLTSLNWLHSLTNILSVPSLPTPPDSPTSPAATAASVATRSADQNPKKLPHKIRFQMSECRLCDTTFTTISIYLLQADFFWFLLLFSLLYSIINFLLQVWKVPNSIKKMETKNHHFRTLH